MPSITPTADSRAAAAPSRVETAPLDVQPDAIAPSRPDGNTLRRATRRAATARLAGQPLSLPAIRVLLGEMLPVLAASLLRGGRTPAASGELLACAVLGLQDAVDARLRLATVGLDAGEALAGAMRLAVRQAFCSAIEQRAQAAEHEIAAAWRHVLHRYPASWTPTGNARRRWRAPS